MLGRKEKLAEFHRANIVEAAKELFREKGMEKTTMDEVAKKAEYSKATIYVYFKSKEEISAAIALESMQALRNAMEVVLKGDKDFFEKYRTMCGALVQLYEKSPEEFMLSTEKMAVNIDENTPQVFQDFCRVGDETNDLIIDFLLQGAKRGLVRKNSTNLETVMFLWGSLTGLIPMAYKKAEYFEQAMGLTREKFLKQSFDTLLSTVLNSSVRVRN